MLAEAWGLAALQWEIGALAAVFFCMSVLLLRHPSGADQRGPDIG
jgi:hypothetical protein